MKAPRSTEAAERPEKARVETIKAGPVFSWLLLLVVIVLEDVILAVVASLLVVAALVVVDELLLMGISPWRQAEVLYVLFTLCRGV